MDQPPAVAFNAFEDVWPRATRNGDRHLPMRHWRERSFDFFFDFFTVEKSVLHIPIITCTSVRQQIIFSNVSITSE